MAVRDDEGTLVAQGRARDHHGPAHRAQPQGPFHRRSSGHSRRDRLGSVNQPLDAARLDRLWAKARAHVGGRDLYIQDLLAGADPGYRLRVRVITETAWHSLFARNMFLVPKDGGQQGSEPDFTVVQLPSLRAEPAQHGTARRP